MKYDEFSQLMSDQRLQRYRVACQNSGTQALKLYSLNLALSQIVFSIIALFELTLRNKINDCIQQHAPQNNWLEYAIQQNVQIALNSQRKLKGRFTAHYINDKKLRIVGELRANIIQSSNNNIVGKFYDNQAFIQINKLNRLDYFLNANDKNISISNIQIRLHQFSFLKCIVGKHGVLHNGVTIKTIANELFDTKKKIPLQHSELITKLNFGFWRYMFTEAQMNAMNYVCMNIFSQAPSGTTYDDIFKQLVIVNELRNRIAHHEPLCFEYNKISTKKIVEQINTIKILFQFMNVDNNELLYFFHLNQSFQQQIDLIHCLYLSTIPKHCRT